MFNVLLIARAPLELFQAIQTSILPHLTRLRASGEGADPFRRSVNITLRAIAGFAGAVAIVMLVAGPALMVVFGGDFDYERWGLVWCRSAMGLYLSAATLNQALLAQGRRGRRARRGSGRPPALWPFSWSPLSRTTPCCPWRWR